MTKKELTIYAQCAEGMLNGDDQLDRQTVKRIIKGHMEYLQSMGKLVEGLSVSISKSASKKRSIQLWSDIELTQYVCDNFYIKDYLDSHYEVDDDDDDAN